MDTKTAGSTYTYIEVQELLNSLSKADITRLIQIYRNMGCEQRAGLTAHDVIYEVTCKVLAMERVWPKDVDVLPYLVETGRSVISNEMKKYGREVSIDSVVISGDDVDPNTEESCIEVNHPSPEVQAVKHQVNAKIEEWIMKIQELFVDDSDATCFISQKLAEIKKAAILLVCKFTDQSYRNVEKRIKDKVRKRFPNGLPWWEIK
jgi:hypothetical protein